MKQSDLRVLVHSSLRAQPSLPEAVDRLNMASRRPSPFNGAGFLQAFVDHDEFAGPGQDVLLLSAMEGEDLVGFLPLRRTPVRLFGLTEHQIEFFVTHDNDRPRITARPQDEERCARAFYRHLRRAKGFSVLELVNQEDDSPLLIPLRERFPGFYARALEGLSTAILDTSQGDLDGWFNAIESAFRHNVGRLGRRFLGSGDIEWVTCSDPRARLPLLELYLDVERRSWKKHNGLGRHPARLALHRLLCEPEQAMRLSFHFLLQDGAAVAGMVDADFPGTRYAMETCYDQALAKLSPGHLMFLMTIREAFRAKAPSYNFFGGYGYYKASWGAELHGTRTLQLFRLGSAHWLKARLGDLRRRLERPETEASGASRFNPVKREVEGRDEAATGPAAPVVGATPPLDAERALTGKILGGLAADGIAVERLRGPALHAVLPFKGRGGHERR